MAFKPAARRNSKLRLALDGPAGSGKTWTALLIAKMFAARVALGDSERSSAEKYARQPGTAEGPGNWDFDHDNLEEKNPQGYIAMAHAAARAGYPVLVIDSFSHSWIGALEQVDKMGGQKFTNGWKVISPLVNKLVDTILSYPGHVIATMRSKSEYVLELNDRGKQAPRKVGTATVAREGTEFEFDVMLRLDADGSLTISKSRCDPLTRWAQDRSLTRDDVPKIVEILKTWLDEGAPPSLCETLCERIRYAQTQADLDALGPELAAMRDAFKAGTLAANEAQAVAAAYRTRKQEIAEVAFTEGPA